MKKKIQLSFIFLLTLGLLASCGKDNKSGSSSSAPSVVDGQDLSVSNPTSGLTTSYLLNYDNPQVKEYSVAAINAFNNWYIGGEKGGVGYNVKAVGVAESRQTQVSNQMNDCKTWGILSYCGPTSFKDLLPTFEVYKPEKVQTADSMNLKEVYCVLDQGQNTKNVSKPSECLDETGKVQYSKINNNRLNQLFNGLVPLSAQQNYNILTIFLGTPGDVYAKRVVTIDLSLHSILNPIGITNLENGISNGIVPFLAY